VFIFQRLDFKCPDLNQANKLLIEEMSSEDSSKQNQEEQSKNMEKEEEAKLKAKYPQVARPGPQFLQKRLHKGQKYFDSGDYNMAKATGKGRLPASALSQPQPPPAVQPQSTGDTIPTPDCLATRKTSIHVQSKLATGAP